MGPGRVLPMRKAGLGQLLVAGQALIGWDRSGRWLRHGFNHFCQNQPSVSRRSEFSAMHRVAFGLDHFAFGDLPTFRWCKEGHSSSMPLGVNASRVVIVAISPSHRQIQCPAGEHDAAG